MKTVSVQQLKQALQDISTVVVASEPMLTEIDTIIGDGDHGYGMRDGFTALQEMLAEEDYPNPYELLRASGIRLLTVMGGASGVIFGTMFTGGHEVIRDKEALTAQDIAKCFDAACKAIMKRGRSAPGDKTMVDALYSACQSMQEALTEGDEVEAILHAAWKGAEQGVEATKNMLPRTGRSKNFREQALGHPDPGAVSVSIIFRELYNSIIKYK